MTLQEVREYPQPPDPLQVALWRDQCLTLPEHHAVMHATDTILILARDRAKTAARNLARAQAASEQANRDLHTAQEAASRFSGPEYRHIL